jgi:phosphoglycolate phosphatase-like HAD superfamily hydrolase
VIAAQTHGIKVIGVLSGIRDRDQLVQYQPDLIVADLAAAVDYIFGRSF